MSSLRAAAPEIDSQPTEEVPDWLRDLEPEQPPSETPTAGTTSEPQKPVTDWLSALRQATPEIEAEQAAASTEEEIPEWLHATQASSESTEPQQSVQPEEGVPDWLKGLGVAAAGAAAAGSFAEEQAQEPAASQNPPADWLSTLRLATPEMEAEQALSEETEPDWLQ